MKLPIAYKAIQILQEYVDRHHGGNVRAASRALGMDPDESPNLSRWLKAYSITANAASARIPRLDKIGPVLDAAGAVLLGPGEALSEVEGDAMERAIAAEAKVRQLELAVAELTAYKNKWEGHLEAIRAAQGAPVPLKKAT